MTNRSFVKKLFPFLSFLLAFIGLFFFFIYKLPFLSNYISLNNNKNFFLLILASGSLIFYLVSVIINKRALTFNKKYVNLSFILVALTILLSTFLAPNFLNSFLGKYYHFQSGVTYLAILALVYIVATNIKIYKRLAWAIFYLTSLFITIPAIFGLIFAKFGLLKVSNTLVYFINNWDVVALTAGIVIILSLIYHETIAYNRRQRLISLILVILHTLLLAVIIFPDIWYAVFFSSLFIFFLSNAKKQIFYKRLSFYILIISLLFSALYVFSSSSWGSKLATNFAQFTNKYSGVNYSFIKPNLGVSFSLVKTELSQGEIFGSGPNEFYQVWREAKPQQVINSAYFDQDFASSYSALTTFLVTWGVIGVAILVVLILALGYKLVRYTRRETKENQQNMDDENKFYLFSTISIFIYAVLTFLFFTNLVEAVILLSIGLTFALANTVEYKEVKNYKLLAFASVVFSALIVFGTVKAVARISTYKEINENIANYRDSSTWNELDSTLTNLVTKSKSDSNYRLLTQVYLLRANQIINASSSNEVKAQELTDVFKKAIASANQAIALDETDYSNYVSLASVYNALMTIDTKNSSLYYLNAKDAYNKALALYPKNPSLYLSLANLVAEYNPQDTANMESYLKQALTIKPNYSEAYYALSKVVAGEGDLTSATNYALQALQSNPQNVDAYIQYGALILNKKNLSLDDINQAYLSFTSALNLDPNNSLAGYYLGATYIVGGKYKEAQEVIDILNKAFPDNPQVAQLQTLLNQQEANSSVETSTSTTATTTKE